jgi:hypothetical protein
MNEGANPLELPCVGLRLDILDKKQRRTEIP